LLLAQAQLLTLLYQIEQDRRQFAESLQKIGQTLSSSLDLRKIPNQILEELDRVVSYEHGAVLLQAEDRLEVVAHRGFSDEAGVSKLQIPIHPEMDDLFQQIVRYHRPVRIGDVAATAIWQQVSGLPADRSWLGVPLVAQAHVIGMIWLTRRETNAFKANDETLVSAFVGQAAVALENARLYDHIICFNDQLEQMVNERTEELNRAYHVELSPVTMDSGYRWLEVVPPGTETALAVTKPYPGPTDAMIGTFANVVFSTQDIQTTYESLVARGVGFTEKPVRQEWGGMQALFADPDGNVCFG
jgi:transcriptional regulator with GAF, ATPase, and Fis domain